jgi:hypothetical protein
MQTRGAIVSAAIVILAAAGLVNLYQVVDAQARQGDPYAIDTQLARLQPAVAALPLPTWICPLPEACWRLTRRVTRWLRAC